MPTLTEIAVYPIKSLDPVQVDCGATVENGALEHDREFAIFDENDNPVTGKRNELVHRLRLSYELETGDLELSPQNSANRASFNVFEERSRINDWLSEFFDEPVELRRNKDGGFPDMRGYASGPTVISTGTLREVASWFSGIDVSEMRLRFRANLEIQGVPAFWEDRLVSDEDSVVTFRIGDVSFEGVSPTPRCIVPVRDPQSGEPFDGFQETFVEKREETLPQWANTERFNHYFYLMVNTAVPPAEVGGRVCVDDLVEITGTRPLRETDEEIS